MLQDIPKKVKHPAMIPFGEMAFFPGQLIHTNECFVNLGKILFVLSYLLEEVFIKSIRHNT